MVSVGQTLGLLGADTDSICDVQKRVYFDVNKDVLNLTSDEKSDLWNVILSLGE